MKTRVLFPNNKLTHRYKVEEYCAELFLSSLEKPVSSFLGVCVDLTLL